MNDIFVYPLQNSKEYKDIINCINNNKGSLLINGLLAVQKPHIAYSMYRDLNRQTIFITNSDLEAKKVYDDIEEIELVGVVTNICVISNAVTFQSQFVDAEIIVDASLTAGFDEEMHKKSLEVMESFQVKVINK